MTVRELAAALASLPAEWQDAEVTVEGGCCGVGGPYDEHSYVRGYVHDDGSRTVEID